MLKKRETLLAVCWVLLGAIVCYVGLLWARVEGNRDVLESFDSSTVRLEIGRDFAEVCRLGYPRSWGFRLWDNVDTLSVANFGTQTQACRTAIEFSLEFHTQSGNVCISLEDYVAGQKGEVPYYFRNVVTADVARSIQAKGLEHLSAVTAVGQALLDIGVCRKLGD